MQRTAQPYHSIRESYITILPMVEECRIYDEHDHLSEVVDCGACLGGDFAEISEKINRADTHHCGLQYVISVILTYVMYLSPRLQRLIIDRMRIFVMEHPLIEIFVPQLF